MKKKDALGDRMKRYEMEEAGRRMLPRLPILARLDGRAFHTFTKGLERPYDRNFSLCMIDTMRMLVGRYNATLGYTQSDEITLYWANDDIEAEMPFDGRYQKFISLLAAGASAYFLKRVMALLPEKADRIPEFDCRAWQVPNEQEVYHNFLWRENDATTNCLQMAAQSQYSQKQLHLKGRDQLHEMLFQVGINWNDYPAFFKRGTYAKRVVFDKWLSAAELARLPETRRPTGPVKRSEVRCLDVPPLSTYDQFAFQMALHSNDPVATRGPLE